MSDRKVCIVTGTRADWGLLLPVARRLRASEGFDVSIAATGMHLSPEFGLTVRTLAEDGFEPAERVEMLLSSDSGVGVAKSVGLGVVGFADAFSRLAPDLVMVLGDRFEILAAAQAALFALIPVAHLCGGDVTAGAYDESIRHAVTKMSHLHFPSNEDAARRIARMGERPECIFTVGSPGIDHLLDLELMPRRRLEEDLGFSFRARNVLVTFHPETLAASTPQAQFREVLAALDALGPETGVIITHPNADSHGRVLIHMLQQFAEERENAIERVSLGQLRYLSVMRQCDVVLGNSSSGLYEAPSFHVPTVNVADRQKGRPRASSVLDCPAERGAILEALNKALLMDCSKTVNPYGDGRAAERIAQALAGVKDWGALVRKGYFEGASQ